MSDKVSKQTISLGNVAPTLSNREPAGGIGMMICFERAQFAIKSVRHPDLSKGLQAQNAHYSPEVF
jgi:hypothetical protein